MRNSLNDWKHTPTTAEVIFDIDLPYRPPKHPFGAFLWRRRLWLETTIGLSLLEPWEKILTLTVFYLLLVLLMTALYKVLPQQLTRVQERTVYYLFDQEAKGVASVSRRIVSDIVGHNVTQEL